MKDNDMWHREDFETGYRQIPTIRIKQVPVNLRKNYD